jgi:translation initiation factor RLI1
MDSKTIRVEIMDGGKKKKFVVHLFNALDGLEFIDTLIATVGDVMALRNGVGKKVSIKPLLKDLLPLATYMSDDWQTVIAPLSEETINNYFENPLAVLELGKKILDHQMVFMKESETFQGLTDAFKNSFSTPISGSVTQ